jgi:sulfatase maturation enzyme AslB (radical SAM superfamily)
MNKNEFSVVLSFDGPVQEIHRERGSFEFLSRILNELMQQPKIDLTVNSVFTPQTIGHLSQTVSWFSKKKVPNITISFSFLESWSDESMEKANQEIKKLVPLMKMRPRKSGRVPVTNLRTEEEQGVFFCAGGKNRIALDPEGNIWGCDLFYDLYKTSKKTQIQRDYGFGKMDEFNKTYPEILSNYSKLTMESFASSRMDCFLCQDNQECTVCPANLRISQYSPFKIPNYICEIQRAFIRAKKDLSS